MLPENTRAPVVVATPASHSHISAFHRPYGPRVHMDEAAASAIPAPAPSPAELPSAPAEFSSPSSAASYLASLRHKKANPEPATPEPESVEPTPAPEPEIPSADAEGDAGPVEEPTTSEEPNGTEPVSKEPPIERPRSWTKEEDTEWQSLPRATQQKIVAREQERDAGLRRSQNEAAEQRKANEAERTKTEQARQQYEDNAKKALKVLEREQLRDFPDIKNMDDVNKLLQTDPLRYMQWDLHQKELVAADQTVREADKQAAATKWTDWVSHTDSENTLAAKAIPELADKEKSAAFYKRAQDRLIELGFAPAELKDLIGGNTKLSIHDHRLQQLLHSDFAHSDMRAAAAKKPATVAPKPAAKPVPPVVRPGTSQPRVNADTAHVKDLESRFNKNPTLDNAAALRQARTRANSQRRTS